MTDEMKPAKLVDIKGKPYFAVVRKNARVACTACAFDGSGCLSNLSLPQRVACLGYDALLTPENYIKLKLKGEVL